MQHVELCPGERLCCFYENDFERRATLEPFFRKGLERNELVVSVNGAQADAALLRDMEKRGLHAAPYLQSGRLLFFPVSDFYLGDTFDLNKLVRSVENAQAHGVGMRLALEMHLLARGESVSAKDLLELEERIYTAFADRNAVVLVQYDKRLFPSDLLVDILNVHPRMALGAHVYENPTYVPPEFYFGPKRAQVELELRLKCLQDKHEQEERYRTLLESSLFPVVVSSLETGETLFANKTALSFLNLPTPPLGRLVEEFWARPEDRALFVKKLRQDGVVTGHETMIRTQNGDLKVVMLSANIVEFCGQQACSTVVTDISERKKTEEALKQSERLYRLLFDSANDSIYMFNLQDPYPGSRIVQVNDVACAKMGVRREEVLGKSLREARLPIDDLDLAEAEIELKEKGKTLRYATHVTSAGERIPIEINTSLFVLDGAPHALAHVRDLSARKKAEEALKRSEARARAILTAIPDLMAVFNSQGRILEFHNASENAFIANPQNPCDSSLETLLPDSLQQKAVEIAKKAIQNGEMLFFEYQQPLKEIGMQNYEARIVKLEQDKALVIVRNMTELRETETALCEANQRLRLVMRFANEGKWECDYSKNSFTLEGQAAVMLGYEQGDATWEANWWRRQIHPEDKKRVLDAIDASLAGENAFYSEEYRFRCKNGSYLWVSGVGGVVRRDNNKRPLLFMGVHQDISQRKKAEQELRNSEMRYRLLADNAKDVIFSLDENFALSYISPAAVSLTGYSIGELMSMAPVNLMTPASRALFLTGAARRLQDEQMGLRDDSSKNWEIECVRKDGESVWVEIVTTAIRDATGLFQGIVGITRDISERKRDEDALRAAKDQADAANTAKSFFLANMSHDLRTPVNGVMGMLQLLQLSELQEEQQECAKIGVKSCQRLMDLLADILDLSKVEAGKMELVTAPIRTRGALEALDNLFQLSAQRAGLSLHVQLDDNVPDTVLGDAQRVQQILTNLVGNALKYTTKGEVSIRVSKTYTHNNGTVQLLFTISDTGVGIPDDMLDTLFESFTQASRAGKQAGVGLGLAIVKSLVNMMRGTISVTSRQGQGSTFYVCLPFQVQTLTPPALDETPENRLGALFQGRRVLVVDDDPVSLFATSAILEKHGVEVEKTGNAEQALELLKGRGFDCVFMDIQLEHMDGVEATRILRTAPEFKHVRSTPVIAMTALAMAGDREHFLTAGMDDYLPKPVAIKELLNVLACSCGKTP